MWLRVDRSDYISFSDYPNVALADDGCALPIWHITITEYAVIAVLRFLGAARDVAVAVSCLHSWMGGNGCIVLVPLPFSACSEVDDTCFLEIIRGFSFDLLVSLVAYCWSSKVDLAWIEPVQRFYPYRFPAGHVYSIPERGRS